MSPIDIHTLSSTHPGLVRPHNEDHSAVEETPNGTLCLVCDGMGGHAGGTEASHLAVDCILQYFNKETYPDVRQALKDALDFANLQIIGTASEKPELNGMGTTACILLLQNTKAWIAHAGDSRIYLYEAKTHRLHRLTKDHSYVQGLVDQGIIYEEEAENHPQKNVILKALGIKENLQPEVAAKPILPAQGDIFLLCSDGLSNMVSDQQIEMILSANMDLKQKETALMNHALASGGLDNITFQLIEITHSPHRKSVFESKSHPAETPKKKISSTIRSAILLLIALAGILTAVWMWKKPTLQPLQKNPSIHQTPHRIHQENDTINHTI
jgi:protein phosphatase